MGCPSKSKRCMNLVSPHGLAQEVARQRPSFALEVDRSPVVGLSLAPSTLKSCASAEGRRDRHPKRQFQAEQDPLHVFSTIAFPHLSLSIFEVLHRSSSLAIKLIAPTNEKPQRKSEAFILSPVVSSPPATRGACTRYADSSCTRQLSRALQNRHQFSHGYLRSG